MSSMSYFRICSMRSIQKTTFCGFIALLNKVLDFGGQLADKLSFILLVEFYFQISGRQEVSVKLKKRPGKIVEFALYHIALWIIFNAFQKLMFTYSQQSKMVMEFCILIMEKSWNFCWANGATTLYLNPNRGKLAKISAHWNFYFLKIFSLLLMLNYGYHFHVP